MADDKDPVEDARQRVIRVAGSRRARLTPAPGTDPSPESAVPGEQNAPATPKVTGAKGPNDDRLRQDVPPHY